MRRDICRLAGVCQPPAPETRYAIIDVNTGRRLRADLEWSDACRGCNGLNATNNTHPFGDVRHAGVRDFSAKGQP